MAVLRDGKDVATVNTADTNPRELARLMAGLALVASDEINLEGQDAANLRLRQLRHFGFGHVPEDRHQMAIVLSFAVSENFILHEYKDGPFARRGLLKFGTNEEYSSQLAGKYNVRLAGLEDPIYSLLSRPSAVDQDPGSGNKAGGIAGQEDG